MDENIEKYFLQPGYIFFSETPHLIYTVLGSCVSVCLWDCRQRFGGINHYIYGSDGQNNRSAKYGDISIRYLVRLMVEAGSLKQFIRAHIIGGGLNPELSSTVGEENILIAEEVLKSYHIAVLTRDTGGHTGRKLVFNNESGKILVYKGISVRRDDWYR